MSIYEFKCRFKCSEHKNLAALFNAEMREFSEFSSVGRVHIDLSDLHVCRFAHVCKSVHVNSITHLSKIYSICNNSTFDYSQDQMQFSFAFMQILLTCKSCP